MSESRLQDKAPIPLVLLVGRPGAHSGRVASLLRDIQLEVETFEEISAALARWQAEPAAMMVLEALEDFDRLRQLAPEIPAVVVADGDGALALGAEEQVGWDELSAATLTRALRRAALRAAHGRASGAAHTGPITQDSLLRQQALLANLVAVARATSERPTLEATLERAFDVLKQTTGAEGGSLLLLDAEGRSRLRLLGRPGDEVIGPEQTALVLDRGLAGWVARHRQAALLSDATDDHRFITLPVQRFAVGSALSVPIVHSERLVGVVTLIHTARGHFDESHLQFLQAAADQLALALLNAQFVEALRLAERRQALLHDVLRSAGAELDPAAALEAATAALARRPPWDQVALAVPDDSGQRLRPRSFNPRSSGSETVSDWSEDSAAGLAHASSRTQVVREVTGRPGVRSELAVPLARGGSRMGVLLAESAWPDGFTPDDVQYAEALAESVALTLDRARLHQAIVADGERLQAVIRSSRDGIMLVGTDGRLSVLNDTALRLLDHPDQSEHWVGRPLASLMERLAPAASRALEASGASVPGSAPRVAGFEGKRYAVRCLCHGIRTPEVSLGRLVMLRDVTEEKKLERMRESLTGTMVHDLRGPLTVVLAALDAVQLLPQSAGEMLERAREAARNMNVLVDGILDLSRLEQGSFPLERRAVPLAALVTRLLDQAAPVADRKQISLRSHLAADGRPAWADPDVLGRVLQNLIHNALKFTPSSGAIEVRAAADAPGWLRITVDDSGPGVPVSLAARVFEKFVAGGEGAGSGLGLAFCRQAVEAHGGRIWQEGGRLGGASFQFTVHSYPPNPEMLEDP